MRRRRVDVRLAARAAWLLDGVSQEGADGHVPARCPGSGWTG
ncbi:hypothetical protein ABZT06_31580 [Streptomyces sp. NPDC005483]